MKKTSRLKKVLLWSLLLLLILVNVMAFLHARKFTRYTPGLAVRSNSAAHYTVGQKLHMLLTGINNPRPVNKTKPNRPYQTIRLQSNKQIECWLIKAAAPKGTILLCHGYGGDKSKMLDKAYAFLDMGYNTMLIDFMGSGGSEGNQTTIGYKEAEEVHICVTYLNQQGEKNIFVFGTSMGAAATMKALQDYPDLPVKAAILECPFSTMLQTVKNRFENQHIPTIPMAWLLVFWGGAQNGFNAFSHNPVEYAAHITTPVLLVWGEKDDRVKRFENDSIFAAFKGPKKLVTFPEAGHDNYLIRYKTEWTAAMKDYLAVFTNH
jgi:pimeloyl-ACP methyl ester carboxylesterase